MLRGVVSGHESRARFQRSFTLRIALSIGTSLPLWTAKRGISQFAPPSSESRCVARIGRGTSSGTGRPRFTKRATSSRISSAVCGSRAMAGKSRERWTLEFYVGLCRHETYIDEERIVREQHELPRLRGRSCAASPWGLRSVPRAPVYGARRNMPARFREERRAPRYLGRGFSACWRCSSRTPS